MLRVAASSPPFPKVKGRPLFSGMGPTYYRGVSKWYYTSRVGGSAQHPPLDCRLQLMWPVMHARKPTPPPGGQTNTWKTLPCPKTSFAGGKNWTFYFRIHISYLNVGIISICFSAPIPPFFKKTHEFFPQWSVISLECIACDAGGITLLGICFPKHIWLTASCVGVRAIRISSLCSL